MLGCPFFPFKIFYSRMHFCVSQKWFFKHEVWIACFLEIPEALSSWFEDQWNGTVNRDPNRATISVKSWGFKKKKNIPHDNLTLLSASSGFSNMKFVQFSPGTLEVLNKGYWLLLVILLYTYFIIFQYSMFKKKVHVIIQCLQRLEGKSESCTRWRNPNYSSQGSSWFPEGR